MPVRLTAPYNGQPANTMYWGVDQSTLRNVGLADDNIEAASDYGQWQRIVTAAAANTSSNAVTYKMNSSSAQTLTVQPSGYWAPGTVLTVEQLGTGATTITGATGVTINTALPGLKTQGQRNVAQLIKEIDGTWTAVGGLGA